MDFAILGAGCFWCIEALFLNIPGAVSVEAGYTGGHIKDPTYESVCSGKTGYVEVCRIEFNSEIITYEKILNIFWKIHDPTTLNQQGADIGTQYRSAIFYNSENQRKTAEGSKKKHQSDFDKPIVTEITELEDYYKAEDYHQNYYSNNPGNPYCRMVIKPKLEKFNNK